MAFEVVSEEEWKKSIEKYLSPGIDNIATIEELDNYLKPTRKTAKSAGYDFNMPFNLICNPGKTYTVPTGFKWNPRDVVFTDWFGNTFLAIFPRSSLGFKVGFRFANTIPIIDADYYNNTSNEGHILLKFSVEKSILFSKGDSFCQGIILPFGIQISEQYVGTVREGGIGSTGR